MEPPVEPQPPSSGQNDCVSAPNDQPGVDLPVGPLAVAEPLALAGPLAVAGPSVQSGEAPALTSPGRPISLYNDTDLRLRRLSRR